MKDEEEQSEYDEDDKALDDDGLPNYQEQSEQEDAHSDTATNQDDKDDEITALREELAQLKAAQAQSQANQSDDATKVSDKLPDSVVQIAEQSGLSDEELAKLFGDFSEKDIAKAVDKLIDLKMNNQVLKTVDERVQAALSPIQQKEQEAAAQAHYQQILSAHPDAGEIADSQALKDWVANLPAYARNGVEAVLKNGSAADVIDVLNDFKASTLKGMENTPKPNANVKNKVPDTLSAIPTGRTASTSTFEQLDNLSESQLLEKLEGMSPEQLEKYLNSI